MTDPENKIHVMPVDPNDWEVEEQSGDVVAHAPDLESAIAVARDVAEERGIETVIVHDGDGVTEAIPSLDTRAAGSATRPDIARRGTDIAQQRLS